MVNATCVIFSLLSMSMKKIATNKRIFFFRHSLENIKTSRILFVVKITFKLNISFRPNAYPFIKIYLKGLWEIRERDIDSYDNNGARKIFILILAGTMVAGAISIVSLIA